MFEKFGELNSFGEINELAENLFNEGDTESLRAMAKENGIQSDFVDMYLQGEIPALCDQLTAALGKIDVEVAELKPKEIICAKQQRDSRGCGNIRNNSAQTPH